MTYHVLSEKQTSPVLPCRGPTSVNKKESVHINVILRGVRVAIVAAEKL